MKIKIGIIISGLLGVLAQFNSAFAQAPSSIAGDGCLAGIITGTYPLAGYGYSIFLPANSGNSYQLIGIYNVDSSTGTYSYTPTSSSAATVAVNDSLGGPGALYLTFSTANSGTFNTVVNAYPSAYQSGQFSFASYNAPSSVSGKTFACSIVNGLYPFYSSGSYTITTASSGNTYTTSTGDSGTYSYSLANRSTGKLQFSSSLVGSFVAYFGFSDALHGGFAATQASSGGYQVGNFTQLDTTPPTITIVSPTGGQRWSNSVFTVTGTASDDIQVSAVYYQIFGQGWNLATTSNGWTNWAGNISLSTTGTNVIQAYSVDSSGNSSAIASQNMVYVIAAVASVQTNGNGSISPNYNGQLLEVGKTYSMTATPSSGFAFVNWTGSVVTNNATVQFVMASNLTFTANFIDTNKPTFSITNLVAGQRVSNAVFTVKGTATDNLQVAGVQYRLNGGSWSNATGTANWSAPVTLMPGTNAFAAYATDTTGNVSATNSVSFQYVVTNQLQISVTGLGTISPNYSNAWLEIGRNYSITSAPAAGFRFTNWTGSLITNTAALNFTMASNLTFTANFIDTNKPTFSITNLVAGQRLSNAVFTVKGTATDNWQVAGVQYQLNGGSWGNATGTTNWSAPLTLTPGTNAFAAYATDSTGNVSVTNSVNFQYVVTNQLQVSITGKGTVSPNYSNAWLEIGRNYSITSAPASGFVFTNWQVSTNWISGVTVTGTNLPFMMQSNLTLQANFLDVTKPTLTITLPTANQKMTNALATGLGTASDNWRVTNIWYQLNNGTWSLAATTNSFTNWTTPLLTLVIGTNSLKAYALDLGGNFSLTNSVSFVSSNTFALQLVFTNAQPMKTNGLVFNLQLSTGLNGHIQVSTNLTSWATLTNFVGTNSSITFCDPAATNSSQRFYRAVIP